MNNNNTVILPKHQEYTSKALTALKHGYAATISGEEGSGVTTLCDHIVRTWMDRNPGREVFEFTVGEGENDSLRLLQHLAGHILGDAMPRNWALHSTSELTFLISQRIIKASVGLVFLDRADLAPEGFIDSFLTMTSKCRNDDQAVGMLLGVRNTESQLRLFRKFSSTRVGYATNIRLLGAEEVAAVLVANCPKFAGIEDLLENGNEPAVGAIMEIGKLSGWKFCRLCLFITNLNESVHEVEFNAASVRTLWNKLVILGVLAEAA